jgi:hypothetical protein
MFLRNVGWHSTDYTACHLLWRWFLVQYIFSTLKMEAICSSETSVDTKRTTRLATCFDAGFLLSLFFDPEDGGDMFLRNVGWHSTDCTACHLISRWFLAQFIFSTLKIKAMCSSETSVDTQRTTRRYIPEDGTLHNHRCDNLKSYIIKSCLQSACNCQYNCHEASLLGVFHSQKMLIFTSVEIWRCWRRENGKGGEQWEALHFKRGRQNVRAVKSPRQCPFILPVEECFRKGKALANEEGKDLRRGICYK